MEKKGNVLGFVTIGIIAIVALAAFTGTGLTLSFMGADGKFTYTFDKDHTTLLIGDKTFAPQPAEFTCAYSGRDLVKYQDSESNCWTATASYAGQDYTFTGLATHSLEPFMTVEPRHDGSVTFNDLEVYEGYRSLGHYKTTYTFAIDESEALYSVSKDNPFYIELGSDTHLDLYVRNNLASFNKGNSGYFVRTRHNLLERGEPWEQVNTALSLGDNTIQIPIDTSELGRVEIEIQPFVKFQADVPVLIKQPNPIVLKYEVVREVPAEAESGEPLNLWERFVLWLKDIFG